MTDVYPIRVFCNIIYHNMELFNMQMLGREDALGSLIKRLPSACGFPLDAGFRDV